ncbi:hypothetical protein N7495_003275 [Penicillium taxi]|uniref:uncharacterized protein n=1 Tax=Penicillium taxi TaxID=168475 RepID=UPI002545B0D2|nr:uncharacterized protein N7495_003275 [Penicillium taxi]KAJ5902747.1 hypothetical protein N7495_003275 [Penicillium taxi]
MIKFLLGGSIDRPVESKNGSVNTLDGTGNTIDFAKPRGVAGNPILEKIIFFIAFFILDTAATLFTACTEVLTASRGLHRVVPGPAESSQRGISIVVTFILDLVDGIIFVNVWVIGTGASLVALTDSGFLIAEFIQNSFDEAFGFKVNAIWSINCVRNTTALLAFGFVDDFACHDTCDAGSEILVFIVGLPDFGCLLVCDAALDFRVTTGRNRAVEGIERSIARLALVTNLGVFLGNILLIVIELSCAGLSGGPRIVPLALSLVYLIQDEVA